MKSLFLSIDVLSPAHKIKFKNENKIKTFCGAVTSILAGLVCLVGFIFFSRELFIKTSPISRTISKSTEDSKIFLEDYPLLFSFHTSERHFITEIAEDFELQGIIVDVGINRETPTTFKTVKIGFCEANSAESVPGLAVLAALEGSFCVDTSKQYDLRGNLLEGKPYVTKEYTDDGSSTLIISLKKKPHVTDELFLKKYHRLRMKIDFALRFVNVEDYEDPVKTRIYSEVNTVDNKIVKSSFIQASRDSLRTDSDLVFENYLVEDYLTFSGVTHEYFLPQDDGAVSRIYLMSSNFTNVQSREYIKLQTVLAQLSAVAKIIFTVCKYLIKFTATHDFYKAQIGSLFNGPEPNQRIDATNSITAINRKNSDQSNLVRNSQNVSFWAFYCISKRKFNLSFISPEMLDSLFDVHKLNQRVQNLEEQYSQENFRNRSPFIPR